MSDAKADASRTMLSLPRMVHCSRGPWERRCVRAVIGIDAITSLAARRSTSLVARGRVLPTGREFGGR
jgi:hypothetical protein